MIFKVTSHKPLVWIKDPRSVCGQLAVKCTVVYALNHFGDLVVRKQAKCHIARLARILSI